MTKRHDKKTAANKKEREPLVPGSKVITVKQWECLLERISNGESLRAICRCEDMPAIASVKRLIRDTGDDVVRSQYARACSERAESLFEMALEIADDGRNDTYRDEKGQVKVDYDVVARSRLRVDAIHWNIARMDPKRFGDRITVETKDAVLTPEEVAARVRQLRQEREALERGGR